MQQLATDYQTYIHQSRYARWLDGKGRRETWEETVDRYIDNVVWPKLDSIVTGELKQAILSTDVMPSMRAMMTAGPAMQRTNVAGYNCSYLPIDHPKAFDEAMYILLCGTGVGFSVERQEIAKLPTVPTEFEFVEDVIVVADSKEGWAKALRKLIHCLYNGEIPKWDLSKIRPKGARLKTFGGRASGPEPLEECFQYVVNTFVSAVGRKLNSLECNDIMCKIGESVVVGGVRRSALICLTNLSDQRMRTAKSGNWYDHTPHRQLANISTAYTEKPDAEAFLREWSALIESKAGERGIFNRLAAEAKCEEIGRAILDGGIRHYSLGTNPCGEIILRPHQFCNLTEVVAKAEDTAEDLLKKVRLATILGTIQSAYTDFPYLRKVWQRNTEEERLLGVSFTGIMDNSLLRGDTLGSDVYFDRLAEFLTSARELARDTNNEWADKLGIPRSAAITCVKPSGTVSQLVDSSSGIHGRHSPFYIRTVRADNTDPLTQFMKDSGIPHEPCVSQPERTTIFSFPIKSPEGATIGANMAAIDQLKMWETYQKYWCDHNPSVTVSVAPDEWVSVGAYVYEHFDQMAGVSFLPRFDAVYKQMPYQACTEDEYKELLAKMPEAIDWQQLSQYEETDNTHGSQTMACVGGTCEVVDI